MNDSPSEETPLQKIERQAESIANREEPMSPGEKKATEVGREGWRSWLSSRKERKPHGPDS
jgi:hypothetical protein